MKTLEFFEAAATIERAGTPYVVVTLLATRGYAPQDPGAKMIVDLNGLHWGTVGGGKVEAKAINEAQSILKTDPSQNLVFTPQTLTWNLKRDVGMSCGGEVTFLFELYRPLSWKIAVFGAGHVAQALVRILEPLSCQLSCIDPRPEWINRLPVGKKNISSLVNPNPADTVKTFDAQTYFVVMTQGHATDRPILLEIFSHFPNAPYIGVIGSKVKAIKLRAELKESGISAIALKKLHCPMGLLIGGNDPHEIAISVAAQLLQIRETID